MTAGKTEWSALISLGLSVDISTVRYIHIKVGSHGEINESTNRETHPEWWNTWTLLGYWTKISLIGVTQPQQFHKYQRLKSGIYTEIWWPMVDQKIRKCPFAWYLIRRGKRRVCCVSLKIYICTVITAHKRFRKQETHLVIVYIQKTSWR